uniref:Uncharacterized protein n=1 Tax=Arundo donax TaxID=35708 RepID=A0A0A9Q9B3_ARUDO
MDQYKCCILNSYPYCIMIYTPSSQESLMFRTGKTACSLLVFFV